MAKQTNLALRNSVIYSVFVRNHTKEGTFAAFEQDLDRIYELGTDIIWFMPIHPIGKKNRKGSLGSPYAISDYREINPEFGTMEDFRHVVDKIHEKGMKCIIDVVYNHTSPDSKLFEEHPEWFYQNAYGEYGNHIGAWSDVIDLDYTKRDLWDYQIETLKQWAEIVDGFRCDVASLVPVEFWLEARKQVEKVRPGCIWLAESCEPMFVAYGRSLGIDGASDSELYQAFDICYDYDIHDCMKQTITGEKTLQQYADAINQQELIYPGNYCKLRFMENHDQPRAAALISNEKTLQNYIAFQYLQKGTALLYGGQEVGEDHLPSLFDKDTISWEKKNDFTSMLQHLYGIKKQKVLQSGSYRVYSLEEKALMMVFQNKEEKFVGIFPVKNQEETKVALPQEDLHMFDWNFAIPEGIFLDLLGDRRISVENQTITIHQDPILFRFGVE